MCWSHPMSLHCHMFAEIQCSSVIAWVLMFLHVCVMIWFFLGGGGRMFASSFLRIFPFSIFTRVLLRTIRLSGCRKLCATPSYSLSSGSGLRRLNVPLWFWCWVKRHKESGKNIEWRPCKSNLDVLKIQPLKWWIEWMYELRKPYGIWIANSSPFSWENLQNWHP